MIRYFCCSRKLILGTMAATWYVWRYAAQCPDKCRSTTIAIISKSSTKFWNATKNEEDGPFLGNTNHHKGYHLCNSCGKQFPKPLVSAAATIRDERRS